MKTYFRIIVSVIVEAKMMWSFLTKSIDFELSWFLYFKSD